MCECREPLAFISRTSSALLRYKQRNFISHFSSSFRYPHIPEAPSATKSHLRSMWDTALHFHPSRLPLLISKRLSCTNTWSVLGSSSPLGWPQNSWNCTHWEQGPAELHHQPAHKVNTSISPLRCLCRSSSSPACQGPSNILRNHAGLHVFSLTILFTTVFSWKVTEVSSYIHKDTC